jgi:4-amino-4-deoxy-L-arabinose transferase-like glycosyltransferase
MQRQNQSSHSIKQSTLILFILIVVLAAFSRFYALDRIPPGVWIDEAWKANVGLEAARTGNFRVFYAGSQGREGLWINLLGIAEVTFGVNPFALRFWAALTGTLTVVFLYLLTRHLFSNRIALFATWFLATSFWHLNFSRIAFRAILVPFLMTASLFLLLRAWREQGQTARNVSSYLAALAGGILFGLGFHTYIAFRIAPLFVAVVLILEYLRGRTQGEVTKRWFVLTGVWLVAAVVTALPIGLYSLHHPQAFFQRAASVGMLSRHFSLWEFDVVLSRTLAMFNIRGDTNWRHNLAGSPELLFPAGILFLMGLAMAVRRAFQEGASAISHRLAVAWFVIFLLPGILSYEGFPHAIRTIGVVPPVFVFAGLGADWLLERLKERRTFRWVFLVLVVLTGAVEGYRYFGVWARRPEVAAAFCQPLVRIGQYLNHLPKEMPRYVVVNETGELMPHTNPDGSEKLIPMQAQVVMFVTREDSQVTYLWPEEVRNTHFARGSVIVPLRPEKKLFEDLAQRGLKIREVSRGDFTAVVVE